MENSNKKADVYGYYNYGTHSGHVHIVSKRYYRLPEPYQANSFLCCQCSEWTWKETELCIHCGYSIANHLAKQNIEFQKEQLKTTRFWLALKSAFSLFGLIWLITQAMPSMQHDNFSALILISMLLLPIKYFEKHKKVIEQREAFLNVEYERLSRYQFTKG